MWTDITKLEATEKWVSEFNAIPVKMLEILYNADVDSWREVTKLRIGDTVYYYPANDCGEIVSVDAESGQAEFVIKIAGEKIVATADNIEIERYTSFPAWGTMWSFGDTCDDYWMEELDGVQVMSGHGFRVYAHEEFGYFFGIDGAGYNFYEHHWMPLYDARGLQWHDEALVYDHIQTHQDFGGITMQ